MTMIYMVFSITTYYPAGGMSDCVGMYNTKEEAKAVFKSVVKNVRESKYGTVVMGKLDTATLTYEDIDEEGEDENVT